MSGEQSHPAVVKSGSETKINHKVIYIDSRQDAEAYEAAMNDGYNLVNALAYQHAVVVLLAKGVVA